MADQPSVSTSSTVSTPEQNQPTPPRRNFLTEMAAVLIGGFVGLVPFASGLVCFLDPILRKSGGVGGGDGFLRAGNLTELPSDGSPVRFTLRSDITDAWSTYKNRTIGSIYLRLMPNGQVIAFNDTCTHLGCKVDYQASNSRFFCPCHQSAFDLDGKKQNDTPPRNLDEMKVEVRDGAVWVKYQNFRTATPEQIPIG